MSDKSAPPYASWPSFPFEGDLRVKPLEDPVGVEPPRHGENPAECRACEAPDDSYIWVSEHWRVRSTEGPTGLPMVLVLEPRSHLDLGDLPTMLAAELGVLTVRVERAIRSLDGVARVHVNRWGDGAFHLHVWFLARPSGRLQLRGSFLSMWNEILPPVPEEQWRENLALIAAWLGEFGGKALAEPPHINWTAPARFSPDPDPDPDPDAAASPPLSASGGPAPDEAPESASDPEHHFTDETERDLTEPATGTGGSGPEAGGSGPKDAEPETEPRASGRQTDRRAGADLTPQTT